MLCSWFQVATGGLECMEGLSEPICHGVRPIGVPTPCTKYPWWLWVWPLSIGTAPCGCSGSCGDPLDSVSSLSCRNCAKSLAGKGRRKIGHPKVSRPFPFRLSFTSLSKGFLLFPILSINKDQGNRTYMPEITLQSEWPRFKVMLDVFFEPLHLCRGHL